MLKRKLLAAAIMAITCSAHAKPVKNITLEQIGRFETGVYAEGAAEIVAYDRDTEQLYVINASAKTVDVLSIADPTSPELVNVIDVALVLPDSGGINSVAVHKGLVALAVENQHKQSPGWVAFYDTDGNYLHHVGAGALPDMVTFTPDGKYVLLANEGEPSADYSNDPVGSVTIVQIDKHWHKTRVSTAGFTSFNSNPPAGVRISGPDASVAQDIEPEYIAISEDSKTAFVTLQENNAIAIVDIKKAEVTKLVGLGNKDHSIEGYGLDASNEDSGILINTWPVLGTYMPDAIASYKVKGKTFLITANEGDGREYIYDGASEAECEAAGHVYDDGDCIAHLDESRIRDITMDPVAFPDFATLRARPNIGRLKMINTEGDIDNDGDYDELHVYGARSISIWDDKGKLQSDTGDIMEQVTALTHPDDFNSTNDANDSFDDRSDDKGPEPEGVAIGKIKGRHFAFVGLERIGGVMIFDVSDPKNPRYVSYTNNRDFLVEDVENEDAGDLGPEGILFISEKDSPNGENLVVVGNEVSGSTTIYEVIED
jgi:hypothetical protein